MTLNFFYTSFILRALPAARIIALRRVAMDSCLSNFRQLFATQYSYYNYTFDLDDTAWFYRQFDNLISQLRQTLPTTHFMEIRYRTSSMNKTCKPAAYWNFAVWIGSRPASSYSWSIMRWKKIRPKA